MGARCRHGSVGRVWEGPAWLLRIGHPRLLLRRAAAADLSRAWADPRTGRQRPHLAADRTVRTGGEAGRKRPRARARVDHRGRPAHRHHRAGMNRHNEAPAQVRYASVQDRPPSPVSRMRPLPFTSWTATNPCRASKNHIPPSLSTWRGTFSLWKVRPPSEVTVTLDCWSQAAQNPRNTAVEPDIARNGPSSLARPSPAWTDGSATGTYGPTARASKLDPPSLERKST